MTASNPPEVTAMRPEAGPPNTPRKHRWLWLVLCIVATYLVLAYVVIPLLWRTDLKHHPKLSDGPRITQTANGIPGDPVNLAILGTESDLIHGMSAAKWYPADPITFSTSIRIAVDSVFRRPDDQAPVSDLFLFGHKQDLAFEQPIGDSPRQRHHVRFWLWDRQEDGRPVWFGAATFDERVGLSHTTGQVTHHIGPDVDAERDRIMQGLQQAGWTQEVSYRDGFHKDLSGKNGGGDPWHTDGRLGVAVLKAPAPKPSAGTNALPNR